MFALWIILALLAAFGLIMLIGDRLLKQSLNHEGICPVCNGSGGPCDTCNGFGIIVDATQIQSQLPSDISKETENFSRID
ncbi:hypothetical protein [Leptothoe spongobia]|uniref:Uncharacterized protein n=1 Tax=Leptothoe spongobia TAU-MAC 1115 TaxID=1967444 RepID=A0A947DL76_9CYAN|nr:hypothetical protein [Leptothoe spongobia]MBT9317661.1 hypothetical protein [Leptothoe spongobia TAU-MAC 1115]